MSLTSKDRGLPIAAPMRAPRGGCRPKSVTMLTSRLTTRPSGSFPALVSVQWDVRLLSPERSEETLSRSHSYLSSTMTSNCTASGDQSPSQIRVSTNAIRSADVSSETVQETSMPLIDCPGPRVITSILASTVSHPTPSAAAAVNRNEEVTSPVFSTLNETWQESPGWVSPSHPFESRDSSPPVRGVMLTVCETVDPSSGDALLQTRTSKDRAPGYLSGAWTWM